jgi:hypothetical protein
VFFIWDRADTGYTPDLPDSYGYQDPFLHINPPPSSTPTTVAIKVIGEEKGPSNINRGIRVYSGPGVKYSVLGWTGLDQTFVANATALSTISGDSINDRLWYRIYLPNRLGPGSTFGWIASKKKDGTVLVQEEPSVIVVDVVNADKGRELRLDPSVDCSSGKQDPVNPNCVRVFDNLQKIHRKVLAWSGMKLVRFNTQIIAGELWQEVYIPKFYFVNPKTACNPPPFQDQCVGEIETVWLPDAAVCDPLITNCASVRRFGSYP